MSDLSKPSSPALQADNALATGLVRAIPFVDGSGSSITDFSASPQSLTAKTSGSTAPAAWGTDGDANIGKYVSFDGTSQNSTGSDSGIPIGTADRSLFFLVKTTVSGESFFSGYGTTGGGALAIGGNAGVQELAIDGGSLNAGGGGPFDDGAWHWLGYVCNATTWHFYIDGSPVGTPGGLSGMDTGSSGSWFVGATTALGSYASSMAGVFVWARALSDADVAAFNSDPWAVIRPPARRRRRRGCAGRLGGLPPVGMGGWRPVVSFR